MIKSLFGWLLVIVGFISFSLITVVLFSQESEVIDYIIEGFFLIPFILIFYFGVKILRKQNKKEIENTPKSIDPKDILVEWEISGTEWERFKADKCTPRTTFYNSLIISLLLTVLLFVVIIGSLSLEGLNTIYAGMIIVPIIFSLSYYFTYKNRQNYYGRLYNLNSGKYIISFRYIEYCGKLIPINDGNNYVTSAKINQMSNYTALSINYRGFTYISSINSLLMPIPNQKIEAVKEILNSLKL